MTEENHLDSNCFALTIICHGNDKGHLFDKNKKKAWDTELFVADLSDVETLVGKPENHCNPGLSGVWVLTLFIWFDKVELWNIEIHDDTS